MSDEGFDRSAVADRIVRAAAALIAEGGRDAASTRAVAKAAGVQTPTIYRLFGGVTGLRQAVASAGFADYLQRTPIPPGPVDPLAELRRGWDMHVEFGLGHPGIYTLMYGDPQPEPQSEFVAETTAVLRRRVENVARAGMLVVEVSEAVGLFHAGAIGVVLTLLGTSDEQRDPQLSTTAREALLAVITGRSSLPGDPIVAAAVTLRAHLTEDPGDLSFGERALLAELLDRLAAR